LRDGTIGGEEGAVTAEEAETHGSTINQRAQQAFGVTKGIFYSPAGQHGILEIQDLLAQTGDLMDQFMPGPVLVSHDKM